MTGKTRVPYKRYLVDESCLYHGRLDATGVMQRLLPLLMTTSPMPSRWMIRSSLKNPHPVTLVGTSVAMRLRVGYARG